MSKKLAMTMAMGGAVMLAISMVALYSSDYTKWFPVFLIAGGILIWQGVQKYREA
jgi:hypothetical protein